MIDIHSHILPGLDDGPQTWEEAREMARMAVEDGIRIMVASPHLFPRKNFNLEEINNKETILDHIARFSQDLIQAGIELQIIPGCDFPLSLETLELLQQGRVMTINDANHYILLELPGTAFPPATEQICFNFKSQGITPIITHPERHLIIQEMPQKLKRLLDMGCLAQVTASSLLGGFGRSIAKFTRQLLTKGYCQIIATDAHDTRKRPPLLRRAVEEAARLIGKPRAWAMVTDFPEKIIKGEPCF